MTSVEIVRFVEDAILRGRDGNRLVDVLLLGNDGAQSKRVGYDGVSKDVNTGATLATGLYSDVVQNTAGNHVAVLLGATSSSATPTTANAVLLIQDAGLSIGNGRELRLYNAAGSNYVNLYHSGTNDLLKTDDSLMVAVALGVGVTPGALGAGEVLASGDIGWRSGTANTVTLVHAATADRTWTFQDATDTVVGRATTDTLTNKTLTSPAINGTVTTTGLVMPAFAMGGHLTFVPHNTYDIGASGGVTSPRDLFVARNGAFGGALAVTGALTAGSLAVVDLVVTDDLTAGDADTDLHTLIGVTTFRNAAATQYALYVDPSNTRVVIGSNAAVGGLTNDRLTVVGGRAYVIPNNEQQALGIRYGTGSGTFYLGATNSATPSLLFKDTSGDEVLALGDAADTYQAHLTGSGRVTANWYADRMVAGGTSFSGAEDLRSVGPALFDSTLTGLGGGSMTGNFQFFNALDVSGILTAINEINMTTNNQAFRMKDAGGTNRQVLLMNSSSVFQVGNASINNTFVFNNLGLNGSSFGNGTGVVFLADRGGAPTINPTAGGILYSESGAGKWRGSGGTTTTFGPAEPHCPECSSDFVLEWENPRFGRLIVCMLCMTKDNKRGVVLRQAFGAAA